MNLSRLKDIKLFSPEDILELFQMYPGFIEVPKFSELGKVRCSKFCIIQKEDGSSEFSFEVKMEAKP